MERATSAWCCREKVALVASKTSIALITSNNTNEQHVYESWNTKNISITFVHCEDKYHIERKDIGTEE